MFRPNTTCAYYTRQAQADLFGQYTFSAPATTPCTVVDFTIDAKPSPIRSEASASRSRAWQMEGDALFMFLTTSTVQIGDVILFDNFWLEVIGIYIRRDAIGRVSHQEVTFKRREPIS